ncbi:RNA 2'-phosphotransferase [Actinomadura meridiana]|uniref:Probable RNA 2'-phosphotransferase n=1 Tax=Actinomadura meridiana TaxID=559626 RepID=A0ABP8BXC7_9ACTN
MDERRVVRVSKFLAKHLRHRPERIGLTLDAEGWADVPELLAAAARNSFPLTRDELDHVVAVNDKQRFQVDGGRIRAVQGHSLPVELNLSPTLPPSFLYHGTTNRALESIRRDGLLPMGRQSVHLSADPETARRVGARRRGEPVVLIVLARRMAAEGHEFRVSFNGVWLVESVPPGYLCE